MLWTIYHEPPGRRSWVYLAEDRRQPATFRPRGFGAMPPGIPPAYRSHDLLLPRSVRRGRPGYGQAEEDTGGGFWSKFGGVLKQIGVGVYDNRNLILDAISQHGGVQGLSDRCIYDPQCSKYFILAASGASVTAIREAGPGECIGKGIVDASGISGWVSQCSPWDAFGVGPDAGIASESLRKYAWIPVTGLAVAVALWLFKASRRPRVYAARGVRS